MNKEHIKGVDKLTDNPFLNLYHLDARTKSGRAFDYYLASRNDMDNIKIHTHSKRAEGMAIYAISKEKPDCLIMIRQYRYPLDCYLYELPAGLIEIGETAIEAAQREMEEETGLKFIPYEGGFDGFKNAFYLAQGITDESGQMVFGYGKGIPATTKQEDSEEIEVVFVDKKEAVRILCEEQLSMRAGLMLMQFIKADKEAPFSFLEIDRSLMNSYGNEDEKR